MQLTQALRNQQKIQMDLSLMKTKPKPNSTQNHTGTKFCGLIISVCLKIKGCKIDGSLYRYGRTSDY